MSNETPNLYIAWHGVPFMLEECQLACALSVYVTFEDGTRLDDTTIGQVLGASSGLENVNCAGLVAHSQETDNVYPQVLNGGGQWAQWARYKYNRWLEPAAAMPGTWPSSGDLNVCAQLSTQWWG